MKLSDAYTIAQVAQQLKLSPQYALDLAHQYGLARNKFGSAYIFSDADIEVLRGRSRYGGRRSRAYDRFGTRKEEAE